MTPNPAPASAPFSMPCPAASGDPDPGHPLAPADEFALSAAALVGEDRVHDVLEGRPAPREVTGPALVSPLDDWGWLEAGIASGDVLVPCGDVRSRIWHGVEADRDGPTTRRLLTFTTDHRRSARRIIFELLRELCFQRPRWPLVAAAAESAVSDVDPQVRQSAAALLVGTAEPARAMSALVAATDPVVRTALVDAMPWKKIAQRQAILERLRSDHVPAVRLLANIAGFSSADPSAWPAHDAACRAGAGDTDAYRPPAGRPRRYPVGGTAHVGGFTYRVPPGRRRTRGDVR
ncbi:hypothetical protein AB0B86_08400 [Micromonospora sp. NPDC049047]|uniref:hypothetical protein n=1 Tax=Micromonospora sp. NPDC049047 TaxID=3155645 RepID=UPI0033DED1EF